MDAATRELVRRRALGRCEYCAIPQEHVASRFQIEHVVARQHGGSNDVSNLALACDRCNAYKGPNLSAIDPQTGNITALFHPRHDSWHSHFAVSGSVIVGLSDVGRATVRLLRMNAPHRFELRAELGLLAAPPPK
jgi:hypothetical protein